MVHIHSKSILHRDIKLDNILLDKNLNVKLCDFGISKLMKPNKAITEHIGTPVYLAPEIISEKGYTGFAADIWSLGVTAYISLTGEVPFKGSTIGELKKNILLFKFSSQIKKRFSNKWGNILQDMLKKKPSNRISAENLISKYFVMPHDLTKTISTKQRQKALKTIAQFGFPEQFVRTSLEERRINHVHALFCVLTK